MIFIDNIVVDAVTGNFVTKNLVVPVSRPGSSLVAFIGNTAATGANPDFLTVNGVLIPASGSGNAGSNIIVDQYFIPVVPVGNLRLQIRSGSTASSEANLICYIINGVDMAYLSNLVVQGDATAGNVITTLNNSLFNALPGGVVFDAVAVTTAASEGTSPGIYQTQVHNALTNSSGFFASSVRVIPNTMRGGTAGGLLGTEVNTWNFAVATAGASTTSVCLRQSPYPSVWNPNILSKNILDIPEQYGLTAGLTPLIAQYPGSEINFYEESFLHTIGRYLDYPKVVTAKGSTLQLLGVG